MHPRHLSSRALRAPMLILFATLVACHDDPVGPSLPHETAVAVTYCAATAPTWVAFRDGDGGWTREMPDVSAGRTTFRHSFTSARAAIASFTPFPGSEISLLNVLYGAPAELGTAGDTTEIDCIIEAHKSLRGTVAGLGPSQLAIVSVGPLATAFIQQQAGLDFTVQTVPNGPQDLLAIRNAPAATARFILRRDVDLPDGSVIPTLDFESAEAFNLASANVTVENLGGAGAVNLTNLFTPHGEFSLPVSTAVTTATQPYFALPASKLLANDLEELHVSTAGAQTRTVDVFFRSLVDRTLRIGDPMIEPTVSTISSNAPLRLRARFVSQADYDASASAVYEQPERNVFIAVTMTDAYAALAGGYDLDVPDLTSVSGFDAQWGLAPGALINWTGVRSGGTVPLGRGIVPADGAIRRTAVVQRTMTLP